MKTFLRSPHLICHEKGDDSIVLGHFGTRRVYNTFNPDLVLALLKRLKSPATLDQLGKSIKRASSREIRQEVERLSQAGFLLEFKSDTSLQHYRKNAVLSTFVKDQHALAKLSQVVQKTPVGILDLGNFSRAISRSLGEAGFEKVNSVKGDVKDRELEKWAAKQGFFVVIGDVTQKLIFSRLNQFFLSKFKNKPWLLVTIDPFGGVIGPTFGIEGGPCYDCLIDHSKRHFESVYREADYQDLIETHDNPVAEFSNPVMTQNVFSLASIEAIKVLTQLARPQTYDGFYSFDFFNFRMNFQGVTPSPVCPFCAGI